MTILENAFYKKKSPIKYVDTMAVGSLESDLYGNIMFVENNFFIREVSTEDCLNFNLRASDALGYYKKRLINSGPIKVGTYSNDERQIFTNYTFFNQNKSQIFTILSSTVLLNENLEEYNFEYVMGLEFNYKLINEAITSSKNIFYNLDPLNTKFLFNDISFFPKNIDAVELPNYYKHLNKNIGLPI